MRQLPPAAHPCASAGRPVQDPHADAQGSDTKPRPQAPRVPRETTRTRPAAARVSLHSLFRLPPTLSVVRDGVRSSRSDHEAPQRAADGGEREPHDIAQSDREVRYRLCELPSRAHISAPRSGKNKCGRGVAVARDPSKVEVRVRLPPPAPISG